MMNHRDMCDPVNKVMDRQKFNAIVQSDMDALLREAQIFKIFIESRPHATLKNPDGTAARAKIGSLNSFRAAFNWYRLRQSC